MKAFFARLFGIKPLAALDGPDLCRVCGCPLKPSGYHDFGRFEAS